MLADQLKNYLDKVGIHYAWVMAAIVFLFTLANHSKFSSNFNSSNHPSAWLPAYVLSIDNVLYDSHSVPYRCPVDAKDWSYQCSSNCYFT